MKRVIETGVPRSPDPAAPFEPPAVYAELREMGGMCPVRMGNGTEALLVSTREVAKQVLTDPRLSADVTRPGFPLEGHVGGAVDVFAKSMIRRDDPDHARLRRIVSAEFTPSRIAALTPMIDEVASACLAELRAQGSGADAVSIFTTELPSQVICRFLGVPEELRPKLKRLALTVSQEVAPGEKHPLTSMGELLDGLLRQAEPIDGLLGRLRERQQRGEMSHDEVVSMSVLLTLGGHETTANTLAVGMAILLSEPPVVRALIDDPSRLDNALEEVLRVATVNRAAPRRVATEDIEVDGELIPSGTGVIVALHSVNRDPETAVDPEKVVLDRDNPRSHMTFGYGIHQCLGQMLARAELKAGIKALLEGLPEIRLAVPVTELEFYGAGTIYGIAELPLAWSER